MALDHSLAQVLELEAREVLKVNRFKNNLTKTLKINMNN
jgi:hypothetical protein